MRSLALSIVLLALVCTSAQGLIITTADGNGADAMIRGHGTGQAGSNFNGQGLGVHYISLDITDGMRKNFLRFDLGSAGDLSGLTDATLNLTLVGPIGSETGVDTLHVWGLNDGYAGGADDNLDSDAQYNSGGVDPDVPDLGESWGETAINWYNGPGHDAGSNYDASRKVIPSLTQSIGTFDLDPATAVSGDVVSLGGPDLVSFLQADTNDLVTFIIAETSHDGQLMDFFPPPGPTSGWVFADKENSNLSAPPALDLTFATTAAIPEPATLLIWSLLAGLGIGAGWRRRKR